MSKPHGTKEFWLAGLRSEAAAFDSVVSQDGVLELAVPSCPGWQVSDLVQHLTEVYRWVCAHAGRGVTVQPERRGSTKSPDGTPLVVRWQHSYRELIGLLDGLDPELPAWNWGSAPKKAVFWHRRMAHETAVHRWDASMATGLSEPIEARLAGDGLSEVLDTWLPSGRFKGSAPSGRSRRGVVALRAIDLDAVWYVRLRGEGVALLDTDTLLDDDDHHERATASGTASDLLLAVYGRVPFEILQVSGEVSLLDGLRTG